MTTEREIRIFKSKSSYGNYYFKVGEKFYFGWTLKEINKKLKEVLK